MSPQITIADRNCFQLASSLFGKFRRRMVDLDIVNASLRKDLITVNGGLWASVARPRGGSLARMPEATSLAAPQVLK